MDHPTGTHPMLACADAIGSALKDVADLDPVFTTAPDKQAVLLRLTALSGRLEGLRLRVLAAAGDVAEQVAARDQAAWLAHVAHRDRPECRRDLRLARALETRCHAVAAGLREGSVNPTQAAVIVRALSDLPEDLDSEIRDRAEAHLVEQAGQFGPRSLRILGRRVLHVVAPEVADEEERKLLERDDARTQRRTFLTSRADGDGTTDLRIRISDAAASRLFTYLGGFTSPRRRAGQSVSHSDNRPYDQQLGHAFTAFLESVDADGCPCTAGMPPP